MPFFFAIIIILWALAVAKAVFFWVYLWQLKEYHIYRFLDHFRTFKGKKLLLSYVAAFKLIFLTLLFINGGLLLFVMYLLAVVYLAELVFILKNGLKRPVVTFKTAFLILLCILLPTIYVTAMYRVIGFERWFIFLLLLFDILVPLMVSAIVLLVQPIFVAFRMAIIARARRKMSQFKNVTVVAITGSYGKTSTKEFLKTILSQKYAVLATPQHKNSEIGIAQTIIQELTTNHQIFIVEMGAYRKGGIDLLCSIAKPHIGVVTGVNEQHLSTFGSMENLLSAEGGVELYKNLPQNGLLVVNGDNKQCVRLYKNVLSQKKVRAKTYTVKRDKIDSDIWTEDIMIEREHVSFLAMNREKEMAHIEAKVLGRQHIQNLLASILVAKEIGMSVEEISQACGDIEPEQGGMTLKKGIHGIEFIDASYSSNPDGVMADLDYLKVFKGKKIVVMPCLIELGNRSSEIHYEIGKKIAEVCNEAIVTTKDAFGELQMGALAHGMEKSNIVFCETPKEITARITTICKQGDVALLEGRVPGALFTLLNIKKNPLRNKINKRNEVMLFQKSEK